ncbi:MAG: tRNA (adenosine(37)-N6)-threonylcarbamoyltransferase complex dimerization subunit type 1 TsaB [Clostridia bacterium]|nr:tRNA (adenosine(37)-N6)-threonylcarbamoyltransferase complex dimerization subunit type 1 TsaB [Clostridia bacterium]
MKILGIDTSSAVASAALIDDEKLIAEYTLNLKKTHSEMLLPMISAMLDACSCSAEDIDAFAVSVGPGSFTGLRIGIATAKGLAHATGKKVVPVGTLPALAFNLPMCEHLIVPIMDARRSQVYTGTYIWDEEGFREIEEPRAVSIDECIEDCGNFLDVVFVGDGVPVYREYITDKLGEHAKFAPPGNLLQRASSVAALGLRNIDSAVSCHNVVPFYIRKSQAEREYEEKHGKDTI